MTAKSDVRQGRLAIMRLEDTIQDARYGLRAMGHSPGFTLTAVLTLALTIGAVSTVLTIVNTLFFQYLPVSNPEALVKVAVTRRHGTESGFVSYPDYVEFRDAALTLTGLAAHYSSAPLFATAGDGARQINGAVVSANFFPLLGLQPVLGRFFGPEEDRVPDRDRVAVIAHELWQSSFGGAPDVLGATIGLNGVPFTIVGVLPDTFRGMTPTPNQIYIPTMMLSMGYRWCADSLAADCTILEMVGRLADGQTLVEARTEMLTVMPDRWRQAADGDNSGVDVVALRGISPSPADRQVVQLLALVSGMLLLICCANLAGLLIGRSAARGRELAIRASLGASSARLVRQLLTESVLLAVIGGLCGVGLSVWMTELLGSLFYSVDYAGRALFFDFTLQPAVVAAVLGISMLTGLAFGVIPAVGSIRAGTAERMKRQSAGAGTRTRIGQWLIGAQAAAAVALVVMAALLAGSASQLVTGTNFDPSPVALMRVRPNLLGYSPERAQQFLQAVIDRLGALPGVVSVSMVGTGGVLTGFEAEVSRPDWDSASAPLRSGYIEIGPRYFETLGIPWLRGRDFESRDAVGAPSVAIVSAGLARRLWPDGDAIGQTIGVGPVNLFESDLSTHRPHQVIGIAQDVALQSRAEALKPFVYLPYWQNDSQVDARVMVRVSGDPAATTPALVREVHRVDPEVPLAETLPLPVQIAGAFRTLRMSATFVGYAGGLTALLSALGLYSALAFTVSLRTREIGIRMAIGAAPASMLTMIAREGMTVIVLGVAAGLGLALGGRRLLVHFLYGPAGGDPVVLAGAAILVIGVGLLACWIPARRAATIEPMQALRHE